MRVIVGLSGGVDSALAAARLIQAGHQVEGLFMVNWAEDESGYCTAAEDFQEARRVADELNIPLHQADFSAEYRAHVFQDFLDEYAKGRTPNPDILCNREIKFKVFREYALALGAEAIATGHYARLIYPEDNLKNIPELHQGIDANKDQTYFLAGVPRENFAQVLFPIGDLSKPQVRDLAAKIGLPNFARKDSTGVCFIGERPFRDFLGNYLPAQAGEICIVETGRVIGKHSGLMYYTLGQRRGLGIGGVKGADERPWFVCEKNLSQKKLFVTQNPEYPTLYSDMLWVKNWHWLVEKPNLPWRGTARIRHRQAVQACEVFLDQENGAYQVRFDVPQWAIAPGQFIVLYDGSQCIASGVMETEVCAV